MVVTHFIATTDALTSSVWFFTIASGSEVHCLVRQRVLPFCLQSCDMHQPAFLLSLSFVQHALTGLDPGIAAVPCGGLGLRSGLRVYLACSPVISHRIEFKVRLSGASVFADWHFVFSCSPRSDYAAAVTFHYRNSDLVPDGDFHPATLCALTVAPGHPCRGLSPGHTCGGLGIRRTPRFSN